MHVKRILIIVLILAALLTPSSAGATSIESSARAVEGVTCRLPESNAEALVILNNYYPKRYYWDHTDLTIAVQAHPSTTDEQMDALRGAIDEWNDVLLRCFDGLITLTDVTDTAQNEQKADIVVHFVPHAGGAVFAGYAICGAGGCPNILVRSENPPAWDSAAYDAQLIEWIAMHEIGHALGLGHATNLLESTDLMGYGWPDLGDPVLSQCDVDALTFIFSWAIEGTKPAPPGPGPYECS
jgi:hypothetical protein